jgi:hypothetical protein
MLNAVFTGIWSQKTSSSAYISVDRKTLTLTLKVLGALGEATAGLEL